MNKVLAIKDTNPRYWAIRVGASQYSEGEIVSTLHDIDAANAEWNAVVSDIWGTVLAGQGLIEGYDSDAHRALAITIAEMDGGLYPGDAQNGQYTWPVRKWQADVKRLRRDIKKLQKLAAKLSERV